MVRVCVGGLAALGVVVVGAMTAGCERGALQRLDAGGVGASGGSSSVGSGGTGAGGAPDAAVDGPIVVGWRAPGESCASPAECATGFCADGVCCRSACGGPCRACALPSAPGTCVNVADGAADPRGACRDEGAARCGQNGKCDGAGACRLYPPGTECQLGTCASDALVSRQVCDGNGACRPGPTEICAPFTCDPARRQCFSTCITSAECVQGRTCAAGSCRMPAKERCQRDAECASGHCVDSVCCNTGCSGPCLSCALSEHLGTCFPIARGEPDPRGVCRSDLPSSCGQNGTCTGGGECARYPAGTLCKAPSCVDDLLTPAGACDSLGMCAIPAPLSCLPSHCAGSACSTPCSSDSTCLANTFCGNDGGACRPKQPVGFACTLDKGCLSDHCADGVCCDVACQGACRSCAIPGRNGTCVAVATGAVDPHAVCPDQGAASCGTAGTCDGSGGCARYASGTVCSAAKCADSVLFAPGTCDATGTCLSTPLANCGPFQCDAQAVRCKAVCTSSIDCAPRYSCQGGNCVPDAGANPG